MTVRCSREEHGPARTARRRRTLQRLERQGCFLGPLAGIQAREAALHWQPAFVHHGRHAGSLLRHVAELRAGVDLPPHRTADAGWVPDAVGPDLDLLRHLPAHPGAGLESPRQTDGATRRLSAKRRPYGALSASSALARLERVARIRAQKSAEGETLAASLPSPPHPGVCCSRLDRF